MFHRTLITGREKGIILQIVSVKTNKEISVILNISERTVRKHIEKKFTNY